MKIKFFVTSLLLGAVSVFGNTLGNLIEQSKIPDLKTFRDPFRAPQTRVVLPQENSEDETRHHELYHDGVYTNVSSIEQVNINDLQVTGVIIGKEKRAIARLGSGKGDTFILKEGMKVGPDKIEVKSILPGGIILVEKVVNLYGQDEFLETVIPITTKTNKK